MTLTTIGNDVQSFLGITIGASSRITTTERLAWINEAYRAAQSKLANVSVNFWQGEIQEMDTEDGVGRYELPTNFLAFKRIEIQYDDDKDKVRVAPADINDLWATIDPDSDPYSKTSPFYAIWENDFYIKPIPDEDSADWTTDPGSALKLWFVELQDDLSAGSDVPALPTTYHHILAYPATAKGFRKLRKFTEAKEYDLLWQTGLSSMIAENTHKDKTAPLSFTMTRGTTKKHGIWR